MDVKSESMEVSFTVSFNHAQESINMYSYTKKILQSNFIQLSPNYDLLDMRSSSIQPSGEMWSDDNWVIDHQYNKFLFSYTRDLFLGNY